MKTETFDEGLEIKAKTLTKDLETQSMTLCKGLKIETKTLQKALESNNESKKVKWALQESTVIYNKLLKHKF